MSLSSNNRGKGPKEPWYILTNLPQLPLALSLYRARWGIEQMFKDMKTSGYHLENTQVNTAVPASVRYSTIPEILDTQ
jgi:hypothetical protein